MDCRGDGSDLCENISDDRAGGDVRIRVEMQVFLREVGGDLWWGGGDVENVDDGGSCEEVVEDSEADA